MRSGAVHRGWFITIFALATIAAAWFAFRSPDAPPLPEYDAGGIDARIVASVREAEEVVRSKPDSGAAWGRLGQVLLANELYPQAQYCLEQAERLEPSNPRWPYLQARMNEATNPLVETKLRRAVELCDAETRPGPLLHLGEWLLARGRYDEAIVQFRASLKLAADNPWARIGLARALLAKGDPSGAREELGDATLRHTPRSHHLVLSEIEHQRGNSILAAEAAARSRVLPKDPDPPDPFSAEVVALAVGLRADLARARAKLRDGFVEEAIGMLDDLAKQTPDSHEPWLALAEVRQQVGDLSGAEEAANQACRITPDSTITQSLLGRILLQNGKPQLAVSAFQKAVKCQPGSANAHLALATCLTQLKDADGAEAALRNGIRQVPHSAPLAASLGEHLLRRGRKTDALPVLINAGKLAPDDEKIQQLIEEAKRP